MMSQTSPLAHAVNVDDGIMISRIHHAYLRINKRNDSPALVSLKFSFIGLKSSDRLQHDVIVPFPARAVMTNGIACVWLHGLMTRIYTAFGPLDGNILVAV